MDCYLFIISSLNNPIYRKIQDKRRPLLEHYQIPYTVLLNGSETSVIKDPAVPTLTPLLPDEILFNGEGYNPYMTQKFLSAVKMYFRSFPSFEEVPTYIVRINATVYIHYPDLLALLASPDFPTFRLCAGTEWYKNNIMQGMLMIFSKDVLLAILQDPRIYDKQFMLPINDDFLLDKIARSYADIRFLDSIRPESGANVVDAEGRYLLSVIQPRENDIWIFRICNDNNRDIDLVNWDLLLDYFHEQQYTQRPESLLMHPPPSPLPPHSKKKTPWAIILLLLLLCFSLTLLHSHIIIKHNHHRLHHSRIAAHRQTRGGMLSSLSPGI